MTNSDRAPERVKYSYLRDEKNFDRVLTIVRIFDPESGSVKFGWSINYPTEWKKIDTTEEVNGKRVKKRVFLEKKGDQFSKAIGRNLAMARMIAGAHVAYLLNKNEFPLQAVLRYLIQESERLELPFHVASIAEQHLSQFEQSEFVQQFVPSNTPKKSALDKLLKFLRGN